MTAMETGKSAASPHAPASAIKTIKQKRTRLFYQLTSVVATAALTLGMLPAAAFAAPSGFEGGGSL